MSLDPFTAETVRHCLSYMSDDKIAAHVRCDVKEVRRMRTRYLPKSSAPRPIPEPYHRQKFWSHLGIADVLRRYGRDDIRQIAKDHSVSVNSIRGVVRRNGGARG